MTTKLSVPLLLLSDNPALLGGLSRMCRDLATLCCTLPQFRVGVLGRGIGQNSRLPFLLYDYPEFEQWGERLLPGVWQDFSRGEPGILMSLDDLSRRHWMVNTTGLPPDLAKFLGPGRNFKLDAYTPVDSTCPNGRTLSIADTDALMRFDRVLAASEWGRGVMINSGRKDADWLPHGYWPDQFHVIERPRELLGWNADDIYVGMVAANQARKDWPAAFECFACLKREYGNRFHAWVHIDEPIRHWNIYALAAEYGIDCIELTTHLSDRQLAVRYSACDCTALPSSGEGFGFPIMESLACGTSCAVTNYAGGSELVEQECLVEPIAYRVDGQYCSLRAVLSGSDFAEAAKTQIEKKHQDWEYESSRLAATVAHLSWLVLKYQWEKWVLGGL